MSENRVLSAGNRVTGTLKMRDRKRRIVAVMLTVGGVLCDLLFSAGLSVSVFDSSIFAIFSPELFFIFRCSEIISDRHHAQNCTQYSFTF